MAFPGPYARVYYNEAGEPLGWDNDYPSEPEPNDEDDRWADYEEEPDGPSETKWVTLKITVPWEPGEEHPLLWNWQTLLDTAETVEVEEI